MPTHISFRSHAVNIIILLAHKGWGPDDLLHVLGRASHPLIHEAAPFIPAHVRSVTLRKAWLRVGPPQTPEVTVKDLRRIHKILPTLGSLDDADLLTATCSDPANFNLTDEQQRARQRVEKLLRKAESTNFSDEADSLVAKAQKLRQRYRIAEACAPENLRVISRRVYIHSPWVRQQYHLLGCVAYFNGVASLLLSKHGVATLFGAPSDVEHVVDLYASLNRQCAYFLKRSPGTEAARARGETAAYRRSFWLAYANRIAELLDSATDALGDEAAASDAADALPILRSRYDRALDTLQETFPNMQAMHLTASHAEGFADGETAASSSHLSGDGAGLGGRRAIAQ